MRKFVPSGPAQIRGLTPGQHSCKETSQQWRDAGYNVSPLAGPGNEPAPTASIAMSSAPIGRSI